jgi:hypothetical protein
MAVMDGAPGETAPAWAESVIALAGMRADGLMQAAGITAAIRRAAVEHDGRAFPLAKDRTGP